MADRWFTGYRARQDRAALDRANHLYKTDPAYRAEWDAHQARLDFRARVLKRYGEMLRAAVHRDEMTWEQWIERYTAAEDRLSAKLSAATQRAATQRAAS